MTFITVDTPSVDTSTRTRRTRRDLPRESLVGLSVAMAGTAAVALTADLAGDGLVVRDSAGAAAAPIPFVALFTTLFAVAVAAGVVAAALGRFGRRPRRSFLALAGAVFAVATVPPVLAAEGLGALVGLEIVHVAVAVPIVAMSARWLPVRRMAADQSGPAVYDQPARSE